ncbi:MAG: dTMP kinase [Planctomycetota bacterium]|nr:MAG: dTMP kinase [Planctomycetota bacterium]
MDAGPRAGGVFIVLEGPDGAGKSTQARRLAERLERSGFEVVLVREPGGTPLGERVRELLLDPAEPMSVRAELFLFQAARAQLTERVIRPALAAGRVVVADRFYASTAVYQGFAPGAEMRSPTLDPERAIELSLLATGGLLPDRTLLLTLPPERAARRLEAAAHARGTDRFERREPAFHAAVHEGYRRYRQLAPEPVVTIDADRDVDSVADAVWDAVAPLLGGVRHTEQGAGA